VIELVEQLKAGRALLTAIDSIELLARGHHVDFLTARWDTGAVITWENGHTTVTYEGGGANGVAPVPVTREVVEAGIAAVEEQLEDRQ
jgi:hypothetical protein